MASFNNMNINNGMNVKDDESGSESGSRGEGSLDGCSKPLNGLPTSASQVDNSPTGDGDMVYRAMVCASGKPLSLLKTAAHVTKERMVESGTEKRVEIVVKQEEALPPVAIRYVDIERPLSFTNIFIPKSDGEVLNEVNTFLSTNSISIEKKHPHANVYRCHSIVDCSVVRFDVRLVPASASNPARSGGVSVEFKRTMGPADGFAKIFKLFKLSAGIEQTGNSTGSIHPCCNFECEEGEEVVSAGELDAAISAMVLWIEQDAMEALQCVGQFYIVRNEHVMNSHILLRSVCGVVQKYQRATDDASILTAAVAMSCVRQFLSSSECMHNASTAIATTAVTAKPMATTTMSPELILMLAPGVTRAAMNNDLTSRREAVGLLLDLNPLFSADVKSIVAEVQGLSLDSVRRIIGRHEAPSAIQVA